MRRRTQLSLLAVIAAPVAAGQAAHAGESHTIRMATVAPARSGWARELQTFSRRIAKRTDNRVRVRWYLGGVAGNELQVGNRIKRGQLDGTASGGQLCGKVMPSMQPLRITGTFQHRDEAAYVVRHLRPRLRKEARAAGFELIATAGLGPGVIFLRRPVHSMAQLRKVKLWRWNLDNIAIATERGMGLRPVPAGLYKAGKAFDAKRVDGFYAIPAATLAFQWYTRVRYLIPLKGDFLTGCVLIRQKALDKLSAADRQVVLQEGARLGARVENMGRRQDSALLGRIFRKHGIKTIKIDAAFRAQFFAAARRARAKLPAAVVKRDLINRVLKLLADYRAEHKRH